MHNLTGLYFPSTYLDVEYARPLLLFFDQLNYYHINTTQNPSLQALADENLITGYDPAPLGQKKDQFEKLVDEILRYGSEYYQNYLATLPKHLQSAANEQSINSLIVQFSKEKHPNDTKKLNDFEKLWHARLLLRLDEQLTKEETDLNRQLHSIKSKKESLMASLHGQGDESTSHSQLSTGIIQQPLSTERAWQLLTSWSHLYSNDKTIAGQPAIFCTSSADVGSLLLETCENKTKKEASPIFSLSLPSFISSETEDYAPWRLNLLNHLQNERSALVDLLTDKHQESKGATLRDTEDKWNESIAAITDTQTQYKLIFYDLTPHTAAGLLCDSPPSDNAEKQQAVQSSLLAVMKPL